MSSVEVAWGVWGTRPLRHRQISTRRRSASQLFRRVKDMGKRLLDGSGAVGLEVLAKNYRSLVRNESYPAAPPPSIWQAQL
jgi:hypothetical protein